MLSNVSVAYNFTVISIALLIAGKVTPQATWVWSEAGASVYVGCILGQLLMGYAGDFVGRAHALCLTQCLAVFGALASAILPWGTPSMTYRTLVAARFVVGFGLGGVYPLSAARAFEAAASTAEDDPATAAREAAGRVGDAFFGMVPGTLVQSLAVILLRGLLGPTHQGLQWRLLLGLGAAPSLAVALLSLGHARDDRLGGTSMPAKVAARAASTNRHLAAALAKRTTWRLVVGTGGSWLLWDIVCYGLSLIYPMVIESCFPGESVESVAWQHLVAGVIGAPGVLLTTSLIRHKGLEPKYIQNVGFFAMAASYGLFLAARAVHANKWVLYSAYCVMSFTSSFGPNVTTFILPTSSFPASTRASFAGIGSALGKVGAVIGTEIFPIIYSNFGIDVVLYLCIAVSMLGALVTQTCTDNVLVPRLSVTSTAETALLSDQGLR